MLDQLIADAIEEGYFTADGKRVMLPLEALVELGLTSVTRIDQLKQKLAVWNAANQTENDYVE